MKNIYLIGMMGSGKTSTGKELARLLSVAFSDLDDLIVDRAGKSINDIFRDDGEPCFRKIESDVLTESSKKMDYVFATGGGVILNKENSDLMKRTGTVIYLKTSLEVLWDRIKSAKDRPLLNTRNPKKTLADILRDRSLFYEEVADKKFVTDQKTPEDVAGEIYKACFSSNG